MSVIPTIPGTGRVDSPQLGVRRNLGNELAPLEAQQQTLGVEAQTARAGAGAVTDAFGAIAEYEQKKEKAAEVDVSNRAFIAMNTLTQQHRIQMMHANTRESIEQIVPNYVSSVEAAQKDFLSDPRLGAQGKINLAHGFAKMNGQTTAEFQVASDVKISQLQLATTKEAVHDALKTGDPGMVTNATALIDHALSAGIISPDEAAHEKAQFPETLAKNQILNGIDFDPVATHKLLLQEGTFPEIKDLNLRRQLTREAGEMASRVQSGNLDGLLGQITESPIGDLPTSEQIDQRMRSGAISASGALRAKNAIKVRTGEVARANKEDLVEQSAILKQAVFDVDFTAEKNPQETYKQLNEDIAALPSLERQIPLRMDLKRKMDAFQKKEVAPNHPVEVETYRLMKDSFETGFSPTRSESDWKKEATPEQKKAAEDYYHSILPKMQAWFADKRANNQPIDYKEADDYRRTLTEPWVAGQVRNSLLGTGGFMGGGPARVTVQDKQGKKFTIPAAQLDQAKAAGYTEAK